MVGLRLYPDIEEALEAWIAQQPDPKPSKPEAIRRILRAAIVEKSPAQRPNFSKVEKPGRNSL
jgi:hypothetical protein